MGGMELRSSVSPFYIHPASPAPRRVEGWGSGELPTRVHDIFVSCSSPGTGSDSPCLTTPWLSADVYDNHIMLTSLA